MKALTRNYLSKIGLPNFSRICTSAGINQQQKNEEIRSTIDFQDVSHLSKFSENWWNLHGEMKLLHAMNPLRVQFVRDGLANTGFKESKPSRPLEGIKLLDVGCGGGILSEPLARIGAKVTGLDASKELISIAKDHASLDKDLSSNLEYVFTSIEDFCQEKKEEFDVIVASEILEHVIDQELFLKSCIETLKPNGSIFISTMNKNIVSWLGGIIGAEYILRLVPAGTHDWNKFISPEEAQRLLNRCNCKTLLVHGMFYNLVTSKWSWTSSTTVNYVLHAVKQETTKKEN